MLISFISKILNFFKTSNTTLTNSPSISTTPSNIVTTTTEVTTYRPVSSYSAEYAVLEIVDTETGDILKKAYNPDVTEIFNFHAQVAHLNNAPMVSNGEAVYPGFVYGRDIPARYLLVTRPLTSAERVLYDHKY